MRRPRVRAAGPILGIAVGVLATGCSPAAAAPAAPPPPAPGIAWNYLGRTPGDGASIFEACVPMPMPGKGYSRRLIATDPGNWASGRVPSITVDSQGC